MNFLKFVSLCAIQAKVIGVSPALLTQQEVTFSALVLHTHYEGSESPEIVPRVTVQPSGDSHEASPLCTPSTGARLCLCPEKPGSTPLGTLVPMLLASWIPSCAVVSVGERSSPPVPPTTCVKLAWRSGVQATRLTLHALKNFQENHSFSFQLVLSKGQELSLNDKCQALLSAVGTGLLTRPSVCSSASPSSSCIW